MQDNFRKLNEDNEIILFEKKSKLSSVKNINLNIGDAFISPSDTVRNLGVTYDQTMSIEIHVRNVCGNAHYQIRNISEIRKYLSPSALRTIVQTNVIARLDYGNLLLYGLPSTTLNKLHHVHNADNRLVNRTPYRHVTT